MGIWWFRIYPKLAVRDVSMGIWKAKSKIFNIVIVILIVTTGFYGYGCKSDRVSEINKDELIKMNLEGVRIEAITLAPVILLKEEEGEKYLTIWIGLSEAYSIALQLAETQYIRPLTHDLIVTILNELGAGIEYIVIKDVTDDVFYADIYLRGNWNKLTAIDCRPSDAIAIAVRLGCEIYVEPHVLDKVGIEIRTPEEEFKEL